MTGHLLFAFRAPGGEIWNGERRRRVARLLLFFGRQALDGIDDDTWAMLDDEGLTLADVDDLRALVAASVESDTSPEVFA